MSNSSLVNYTLISPNKTEGRLYPITKLTIHHMAGNLSVETCGDVFQHRKASANYGIDSKGRVGMYVEEKDRSWCSSSSDNDNRAITIEVANDGGAPDWHVSDIAFNKLIDLCVDICQRNNIKKINYTGDVSGNLTMHCWFTATACPGPYLKSRFQDIANLINKRLGNMDEEIYATQPIDRDTTKDQIYVAIKNLNARTTHSTDLPSLGYVAPGYYNIYDTFVGAKHKWYKIYEDKDIWCAGVDGVVEYEGKPEIDWKEKYEDLVEQIRLIIG